MNFTVFSQPVRLRHGQVFNKVQRVESLPESIVERYADGNKLLAITGFDVDMVRRSADGSETEVKLSDHYLHHYALYLGQSHSMNAMFDHAERDVMFRRMLTGCHAMKGSAVRSFMEDVWHESSAGRHRLSMFGSASGAEYRNNPQRFEKPYRMILEKPSAWAPLLHIIRAGETADAPVSGAYSPLIECPCTPQRRIDVDNGTIDGKSPDPPIRCSPEFTATGNPSCSLGTYVGGWRCCEHGVFLVDTDKECSDASCSEKPLDEVYMKFTFFYEDAAPGARQIENSACCDVTGQMPEQGFENIEYDVPACTPGTPPEQCFHVAESVQTIGFYNEHKKSPGSPHKASDLVDLVFMAPHIHVAGTSVSLQDALTNETLCEVHRSDGDKGGVAYGHTDAPGDESGYLVGLSTCRWSGDTAPRYRRDHPFRIRVVYNATRSHTGVMGLWLGTVSAVGDPDLLV